MGLTVWLLERKVAQAERALMRIRADMVQVCEDERAGRLTKAALRDRIEALEREAKEWHATLGTRMGELRRARHHGKKTSSTRVGTALTR